MLHNPLFAKNMMASGKADLLMLIVMENLGLVDTAGTGPGAGPAALGLSSSGR